MPFIRSETVDNISFVASQNFVNAASVNQTNIPFSFALANELLETQDWIEKIILRKDFFINRLAGTASGSFPAFYYMPNLFFNSSIQSVKLDVNSYGSFTSEENLYYRPQILELKRAQPINNITIKSDTDNFFIPDVLSLFGILTGDPSFAYDVTAKFTIQCIKSDKKYYPQVTRKENKKFLNP